MYTKTNKKNVTDVSSILFSVCNNHQNMFFSGWGSGKVYSLNIFYGGKM